MGKHVEWLCAWKKHGDPKELEEAQCTWSRENMEPVVKILIFLE